MRLRSPDIVIQHQHHTLLSRKLDNHMYSLGVGCILSMVFITLGLFLLG